MTKTDPLGISKFDAAEYLQDEESIAEYLNASTEMNDPTVLLNAVSTVVRARSMSPMASPRARSRVGVLRRPVRASAGTVTAKATGTRKVRPVCSQAG